MPFSIDIVADLNATQFKQKYLKRRRPVLIKGGCSNWPAVARWSASYFESKFGSLSIPLKTFEKSGIKKTLTTLGHYSQQIQNYEACSTERRPPYCHDIPMFTMEPRLIKDIESFPSHILPSAYKRWWAYCQFFFGPKGSVTPLHFDCLLTNNLFFQIDGTKRFTLLPPESAKSCGQYNWRWFRLDPENPDYDEFPDYKPELAVVVDVEPGDILFMPSATLHHVRSLSTCISFNIDFHDLRSAFQGVLALKQGIPTQNAYYNALSLCRLATLMPEKLFMRYYKSYLNYVS